MSINPSLKGKRKKTIPKKANPLFTKWLTEWKDEASEKGWKSHHTFAKALKTIKLFPLTLESGKDCKMLQNFGDKICKMLDEKLAEHRLTNGSVDPHDSNDVQDKRDKESAPVLAPKESASSKTHVISDNSGSESEQCKSPPKKKRSSSQRKPREYVPGHRSGPYALILTLFKCMQDPDFKGFMTKSELCHAAQPLSDKSFTRPDPGSHYTAWSSMSSIIKKEMVKKDGCPARYMLTDAGYDLGMRLENAENGGTLRTLSSSESNLSANVSCNSARSQSNTHSESSCHATSSFAAQKIARSPEQIILSDSDGGFGEDLSQPFCGNPRVEVPTGDRLHLLPSDSEGEQHDTENILQDWNDRNSPHQNHGICDDPVYLVLSDGEDDNANAGTASVSPVRRNYRLHSLSPSPPSSPSHQDFQRPQTVSRADLLSWKDNEPSVSPRTQAPSPAPETDIDDVEIISVDDEEFGDYHRIEYPSESKVSKISYDIKDKVRKIPTFDDDDDDDDLPPLDHFIPLSQRLKKKGLVSSSLLNSHISSCEIQKSSFMDNHLMKEKVDARTKAVTKIAPRLESEHQLSSEPFTFTSVQEKNAISGSSSSHLAPTSSNNNEKTLNSMHPSGVSNSSVENSKPTPTFTFRPGTFDIVLLVDQREFYGSKSNSKTLLPDLIKSGVNCDLRHLNISDLLWVAKEKSEPGNCLDSPTRRELVLNYAIERKRMDDLVSSISSGRLKEQKFRLKHSGVSELIILIEEYGSIQNFSLSEDRIKQSIVNSQIIDGFKVKRCGSSKDAIAYLSLMTRFLQSHFHSKTLHAVSHEWLKDNKKSSINDSQQYLMPFESFNEASIKQKTLCVREMFAKHLLQFPGISLERASAITKIYPSLLSLIEAYKQCSTEKAKESLLASIKCGSKQRNLGIAVSRTVSMMYSTPGALS